MPWGCCSGASGFIKAGTLALFIEVPGIEFILVRLGKANKFALLSASTYICNSIRRIQYE